jgi:signal transduction histidine kinase/DNA-binding response OmpR family regulator
MDKEQQTNVIRVAEFLSGENEMAAMIRARDWSRTSLGSPDSWPNSLRTVVRIMLDSRYAIWIGWGPDLTFLYNDAYRAMTLGKKHPWALGQPAREVWAEAWRVLGPRVEEVVRYGQATYDENLLLLLERSGYSEETYHTFSYSPLPDDKGNIGGLLCIVVEGTNRYIAERRLKVLRDVAAQVANTRTEDDLFSAITKCIGANQHDVPFSLIYLAEPSGQQAHLVCSSGIKPGHAAAPLLLEVNRANDGPWPIQRVLSQVETVLIDDLVDRFQDLPLGAWDVAPRTAVLVPIPQQGQAQPAGVMIIGANPYRPLDDTYIGFINLLAGQIAAGLADVRAHGEQRKRAEALAEIDRAKTTFFSNASHEFRTPLTLMLSPLEELLARSAGSNSVIAQRNEIELIHRNGLRLLRLVNTLLDFSRIEAGRLQASYQAVDLAAYTAELASNFRSAMDKAGIGYVINCESLPEPVYVDCEMWEKIVLNLISNAFKYTLQGEVVVSVGTSPDRKYAELVVRDTGVGIPAHELPRLFERFHRIEGQVGRTHEGTGIGLALVQELVRLHGGDVRVKSIVGKGSTFAIFIPFGDKHLSPDRIGRENALLPTDLRAQAFVEEALRWLSDASDTELIVEKELTSPLIGSTTNDDRALVLIADDNSDMRHYIRRLLGLRYDIEAVADGRAALECVRQRRPDLILADIMMPHLDGFGLLREIRSDPELRDLPIILLSARAGDEASIEGRTLGADDYVTKPFGARELIARVQATLNLARGRQQVANVLRDEARRLETLNQTGSMLAAELDLERLVQMVTDAAVELTRAQFGAFLYKTTNDGDESYVLRTSGGAAWPFSRLQMKRSMALVEQTFRAAGVIRSDDILQDRRNALPFDSIGGGVQVRSYLAAPIVSRTNDVRGGLFLGHGQSGVFSQRDELIIAGMTTQAAVALDNARLYRESRKAEEELLSLNETLEQRVKAEIAERMKAEEAFRQAQKMESIGQLTGGVAHDFNNLLQVIVGNLYVLQKRVATGNFSQEDLIHLVERSIKGAQRAASLTQKLLAFSRRQPLDPKPLDVNRLVSGMSELLRRTLGESINIETILAGGLWRISADANELENALLNLAVNARDAMSGRGRLTIETSNSYIDDAYASAHEELTPGQYVAIAISDTGVGMTKDVMAKAFEPFFTTKEVGQGTGLGLSQVYGFVKQSGGHVKIYSELNEGTTVKVYLPRLVEDRSDSMSEPTKVQLPLGSDNMVICIVEDDDDVRENTVSMLRELSYAVHEAFDGPSALRLLQGKSPVDLLFTDIGLPGGINGRQLADQARMLRPELKVLFMSGYARNAMVHQGRLDSGVELITKPFTLAQLAIKIRQLLGNDK